MQKRIPSHPGVNILIDHLSVADRALIEPHLELVDLGKGFVLESADAAPAYAYFPVTGVASVVTYSDGNRQIEAGLFGYEGMSGIGAITTGTCSPSNIFMQILGMGLRIETNRLSDLQQASWTLHTHFLRYIHSIIVQLAQTALSNGHAKVPERLARWILMCHDRTDGNRVVLTHEFLALMLGVRRAGVTEGTHILEGKRLIRAERGQIIILDRVGLEAEADGSYGISEAEYIRLIPPQTGA
ncbi:Crp/Fnr family transcriptional regulator [Falsirhodobacter sp. 1013]|uniref:Crp/Fnr family transcriptional regulator n=1 Tax=Falsirhodobacter sp. 1013 TaxID=3417566 RepID=UPI003EBD78C1